MQRIQNTHNTTHYYESTLVAVKSTTRNDLLVIPAEVFTSYKFAVLSH